MRRRLENSEQTSIQSLHARSNCRPRERLSVRDYAGNLRRRALLGAIWWYVLLKHPKPSALPEEKLHRFPPRNTSVALSGLLSSRRRARHPSHFARCVRSPLAFRVRSANTAQTLQLWTIDVKPGQRRPMFSQSFAESLSAISGVARRLTSSSCAFCVILAIGQPQGRPHNPQCVGSAG